MSSIIPPPTMAPSDSAAARTPPARMRSDAGSRRMARALTGMSAQVAASAAAKARPNSHRRSASNCCQPRASSTAA
ncbi:hypothetical protein GY15_03320 [Delftia sp. 670]|nr:hypothetical protein GY15_03320 [Delftia sp. 670]